MIFFSKSYALRTLILPPFYKHNRNDETSEGHNPIAEPAMRIDISGNRILQSELTGSNLDAANIFLVIFSNMLGNLL